MAWHDSTSVESEGISIFTYNSSETPILEEMTDGSSSATKERSLEEGKLQGSEETAKLEDIEEESVESVRTTGKHENRTAEKPMFECGRPYKYFPSREEGVDYWANILEPIQRKDATRCNVWKDEVQNILIFAGLFSAVVTAFLIESYKNLQQNPEDTMVSLLTHIAARLDSPSNLSTPLAVSQPAHFTPTTSAVRVNIAWFLSLVLSLSTVLIGIVSLQWLREHQSYPETFTAEQTFTLLHMRNEMLEKWHVSAFFAALPVLLQVALGLFLGGLADFLTSLGNALVIGPVVVLIGLSLTFLFATTVLPTLQLLTFVEKVPKNQTVPTPCPYKSPQAELFRSIGSSLLPLLFHLSRFSSHFKRSMLAATNWTDLDLRWLSARRHYASKLLLGDHFSLSYEPSDSAWEKDSASGPLYDQIKGLQHMCQVYPDDHAILLSASQCFVRAISHNSTPGELSLKDLAGYAGDQYYQAVIRMLQPSPHFTVSDVFDGRLSLEALYDEVLLAFFTPTLNSEVHEIKLICKEISLRLLQFLFERKEDNIRPEKELVLRPLSFTEQISWGMIQFHTSTLPDVEEQYVTSQARQTLDLVFRPIAKDYASAVVGQLFSYRGLAAVIERCMWDPPTSNSSSPSIPFLPSPAVGAMKATFDNYCTSRASSATFESAHKYRLISYLPPATALVFLFSDSLSLPPSFHIPEDVIELSRSLHTFCDLVLSKSGSPETDELRFKLESVLGDGLEEVRRMCSSVLRMVIQFEPFLSGLTPESANTINGGRSSPPPRRYNTV